MTAHSLYPATSIVSATEARKIMAGKFEEVWKIKKGLAQPEDLTWKLPVQMGVISEGLNRSFYSHEYERPVYAGTSASLLMELQANQNKNACVAEWDTTRHPTDILIRSKHHPWAVCHPDGLVRIEGELGLWEAKHTDAISQWNDAERVVKTNWWQFVHQMMTCDMPWVEVSVIYGNGNDHKVHRVYRDMDEEAVLVGTCVEFLETLKHETPPADRTVVKGEGEIGVGGRTKWNKKYTQAQLTNLPCSNTFPGDAAEYLANESSARIFERAKKALKESMPEDAASMTAHGVVIKRSASGSITITKEKK